MFVKMMSVLRMEMNFNGRENSRARQHFLEGAIKWATDEFSWPSERFLSGQEKADEVTCGPGTIKVLGCVASRITSGAL